MAVYNAGFELGADQAAVATTDRGDGDAWNLVSKPAAGTIIYDSTHAALGAQSCKLATAGTAGAVTLTWGGTGAFGTLTDHYGRIYVYATANPAANWNLVQPVSTATACATLRITTAGKIQLLDTGATQRALSTNAISLNQWIRIEFRVTHSTTAGFIEAVLFNTATSGTADETVTSSGSFSTLASCDRIRFGNGTSAASFGPVWVDQIQAGATAYPGVAPVGIPRGALLGVGT